MEDEFEQRTYRALGAYAFKSQGGQKYQRA